MVDCSCIKGESNFKFRLESMSSEELLYKDWSDWMDHPNYKDPDEYTLSITPPGYKEGIDIVINVQKGNKITSKELFGTEGQSIPDGIYCLKITNCGYTYTRYHAVTYKLECCAKKLFLDGVNTIEIDNLIKGIKYTTELQEAETANKLYSRTLQKVEQYNCSCN